MEYLNVKETISSVVYDLTHDVKLSNVLLKVQAIASRLENEKLRKWFKNEMEGYSSIKDVPDCRKIPAISKVDMILFQGKQITRSIDISRITNKYVQQRLRWAYIYIPLCEIEAICNSKEEQIFYDLTGILGSYIQENLYPIHNVLSVYLVVAKVSFTNIIQRVKSELLELFLEMDKLQFNNKIDFNVMNDKINTYMSKTINATNYFEETASVNMSGSVNVVGDNNTVNTSQINTDQAQKLREIVDQIEELSADVEADRNDIAEAIADIRTELDSTKNPKRIKQLFNALKGILSSAAGMNGTIELIKKGLDFLG